MTHSQINLILLALTYFIIPFVFAIAVNRFKSIVRNTFKTTSELNITFTASKLINAAKSRFTFSIIITLGIIIYIVMCAMNDTRPDIDFTIIFLVEGGVSLIASKHNLEKANKLKDLTEQEFDEKIAKYLKKENTKKQN